MIYDVSDIIREVKIALNLNEESNEIQSTDANTLTLDEIIKQKIEHGVKMILENSPLYLIDTFETLTNPTIKWEDSTKAGIGMGKIRLDDSFLRLHTFKMSDWRYAVTEAIMQGTEAYSFQKSKFKGVRGNPNRPIVAICQDNDGKCLEFYSCNGGDKVTVETCLIINNPTITSEAINIPERLNISCIYQIAGLVAVTIKDPNYTNFFNLAKGVTDEAVSKDKLQE